MIKRLVCRLLGHRLPRRIGPGHPAITVTATYARGAGGICRPIPCERCGHPVDPFDDAYPMIIS